MALRDTGGSGLRAPRAPFRPSRAVAVKQHCHPLPGVGTEHFGTRCPPCWEGSMDGRLLTASHFEQPFCSPECFLSTQIPAPSQPLCTTSWCCCIPAATCGAPGGAVPPLRPMAALCAARTAAHPPLFPTPRDPRGIPAAILRPGALRPLHRGDAEGGLRPEAAAQHPQLVAELRGEQEPPASLVPWVLKPAGGRGRERD